MRWAWPASAVAHAGLAVLLLAPRPQVAAPGSEAPPVEIELVQQEQQDQGAPAAAEARPDPQAADPGPPPERQAEAEPSPPPPAAPQAAAQAAAPPAPQPEPAPRATPAAVHLGDAEREQAALSVTGDNIVPPAPDAVFRNKPPSYPPEAARRGAQGTVRLVIRVSAAGVPDEVVVAASSGVAALDRAAREAALLWRFRPAMSGATPVPFDYVMNIRFTNGGR